MGQCQSSAAHDNVVKPTDSVPSSVFLLPQEEMNGSSNASAKTVDTNSDTKSPDPEQAQEKKEAPQEQSQSKLPPPPPVTTTELDPFVTPNRRFRRYGSKMVQERLDDDSFTKDIDSSWCMLTNSEHSNTSSVQFRRPRGQCTSPANSWGMMDTSLPSVCHREGGDNTSVTADMTDQEWSSDDWGPEHPDAIRRKRLSGMSDKSSASTFADGSMTIHELEEYYDQY